MTILLRLIILNIKKKPKYGRLNIIQKYIFLITLFYQILDAISIVKLTFN